MLGSSAETRNRRHDPPAPLAKVRGSQAVWEWFKEGVKPEHFIVSGHGRQLINR
jgi:hypothetical protein